ncbi:MAG: hypothetical protein ACRELT_03345, partial [Longimicrobiales bacterium]
MHLVPKATAATLALAFVSGCADSPTVPSAVETAGHEAAFLLDGGELDLQRPLLDLNGWVDGRTVVPLEVLTPEAASDVGPGSAIVITIPDEGRFGCTANFIWQARGRFYLGAAGHCFLPETRTATHGPGADYDASGVVVEVCIDGCEGNFNTNLLVGTWGRLGNVAYARQQNEAGSAVGHDFGVVEIPKKIDAVVRRSLPVWGGPTGVHTLQLGDPACHYGHGLGFGEVYPTKARVGVGGGSDEISWAGDFAASPGDSGSALVACESTG